MAQGRSLPLPGIQPRSLLLFVILNCPSPLVSALPKLFPKERGPRNEQGSAVFPRGAHVYLLRFCLVSTRKHKPVIEARMGFAGSEGARYLVNNWFKASEVCCQCFGVRIAE